MLQYLLPPKSPYHSLKKALMYEQYRQAGEGMRRNAMNKLSNLGKLMYSSNEPIIKGEGSEDEQELNDETLNTGQEGI